MEKLTKDQAWDIATSGMLLPYLVYPDSTNVFGKVTCNEMLATFPFDIYKEACRLLGGKGRTVEHLLERIVLCAYLQGGQEQYANTHAALRARINDDPTHARCLQAWELYKAALRVKSFTEIQKLVESLTADECRDAKKFLYSNRDGRKGTLRDRLCSWLWRSGEIVRIDL
jgi:hypothetical protein